MKVIMLQSLGIKVDVSPKDLEEIRSIKSDTFQSILNEI